MANRIASDYGKSPSSLSEWLASNPERSARARQATAMGASAWDAQAEDDLRAAADPFALSKAVALGQHYRWRASKLDQARYGDKQQHEHAGGITVNVNTGVKRADD